MDLTLCISSPDSLSGAFIISFTINQQTSKCFPVSHEMFQQIIKPEEGDV